MEDLEQRKQIESMKRENTYKKQAAGKVLPRRKRATDTARVFSFSQRAFCRDKWAHLAAAFQPQVDGQQAPGSELEARATQATQIRFPDTGEAGSDGALLSDWRESAGDKGTLLFRNISLIRWVVDGADERAREGVITLYLKDPSVNIEVSLYKDKPKDSS